MHCLNCHVGVLRTPRNNHPAYLECSSCGAIELTYMPQDYQEPIHTIEYAEKWSEKHNKWYIETQIIAAMGGYGSGKSAASLQEVFLRSLENPGGTGLLTANTLQQLKRTTLKTFFNEICPPMLIEKNGYNKTEGEIKMINGFTWYVIPSDDEEKIRSINAGIIHIEEISGIKRTIYDQLKMRMRDPYVKNKCLVACSNPDINWIKDEFVDNQQRANPNHPEFENFDSGIHTFVWATHLNQHLPPDYIKVAGKNKPSWWKKRFLEGSFEHSDDMVYPNIASTFIDPYPVIPGKTDKYGIPMNWNRFITLDHGLRNPTAVYFQAIDPIKWEVVTYLEYYKSNILVRDHGTALKEMIDEIMRGKLIMLVADPSIKNRSATDGKSIQMLYEEQGIAWQLGNNKIQAGIIRVNHYIEAGKWKIYNTCVNLRKEAIAYKYKPQSMDDTNKNLDEEPVGTNDHALDSIRYGFMELPDKPEDLQVGGFNPSTKYRREEKIDYNEFGWEEDMKERFGINDDTDWTSFGY